MPRLRTARRGPQACTGRCSGCADRRGDTALWQLHPLPTLCLPADQPVGFWNPVTGPTRQRLAARESWVSGREATAGDPWLSDPPTLRVAPLCGGMVCRAGVHALSQVKEEEGTRKFNTQSRHCDRPLPALGCTHSPACAQHALGEAGRSPPLALRQSLAAPSAAASWAGGWRSDLGLWAPALLLSPG